MPQASFAYDAGMADAGAVPSLAIFADRAHLRGELRDDAAAAGFRIDDAGEVAALLSTLTQAGGERSGSRLADVVLLDCPAGEAGLGGAELAAMVELDGRAAQAGTRLIVSTGVSGLDDVFACMDRSQPRILVDPTRAERLIALGEARAGSGGARVRELSEQDRLVMLRLSEQVGQIARRLDDFSPATTDPFTGGAAVKAPESAFRFGSALQPVATETHLAPAIDPAGAGSVATLPDPRLVRRLIRQRQLRGRFLDADLFADPAWDMLLDLTAAAAEAVRVSVTSLCIASGVPPTTALRWIGQMTEAGLLRRIEDRTDRRRAFIVLTERSREAMGAYFAEVGPAAATTGV